ncbi:MAG: response regulator [Rhizobiaceae bacterium]
MSETFKVLIIEDEALIAMELEGLVEDAGHEVAGWASTFEEAKALIEEKKPDLAFVDLQLADGKTGMDVARFVRDNHQSVVVFMTANPRWLPDDLMGAVGVMAKPYTMSGVLGALRYLYEGIRRPPPVSKRPAGFTLAPAYEAVWAPAVD